LVTARENTKQQIERVNAKMKRQIQFLTVCTGVMACVMLTHSRLHAGGASENTYGYVTPPNICHAATNYTTSLVCEYTEDGLVKYRTYNNLDVTDTAGSCDYQVCVYTNTGGAAYCGTPYTSSPCTWSCSTWQCSDGLAQAITVGHTNSAGCRTATVY